MDWFYAAALAATLFSIVAVLDKPLVGHMFPSARAFNITFGTLQFIRAGVLLVVAVVVTGFDGGSGISWALGSGFLWAIGVTLFFYALSIEDVSRAAPMTAITPLFTALFAVLLLNEPLNGAEWSAMLAVVAGVVLINLRPENGRLRIARGRALCALLASPVFLAAAFIVTDEAAVRMNTVATEGMRSLTMGVGVLAMAWRPRYTAPVVTALRNRRALALILLAEGLLAPLAMLTFVYALSIGPVALVGAIFASWPLGVLLFSTALSTPLWNVLNEPLDRYTIGLKAAATLLIVGGVVAIRLAG